MAIRDVWGPNHSTQVTNATTMNGLNQIGSGFNVFTTGGRWGAGGNTMEMGFDHQTATRGYFRDLSGSESKYGVAMAFSVDITNATTRLWAWVEAGAVHMELRRNASGKLEVARNGTSLGSGPTTIPLGEWHHVEFYVEIHDTNGVVKVWLDGNPTPEIDLSSQDTRNGGTGIIDRWQQNGNTTPNSASRCGFCDIVVYDTTGGMTAPLGDLRVYVVRPTGNGNSSGMTGSDGNSTDNYLLVDETSPDSDTTYVESSSVSTKDTYAFGDVSVSGSVLAVKPYFFARKTDAGFREMASVARLSGSETDQAGKALIVSYLWYHDLVLTKPGGGSWSVSDVNSAEFGLKVTG